LIAVKGRSGVQVSAQWGCKIFVLALATFLAACAGPEPYRYQYVPGRTATLEGETAVAPPSAPAAVARAIDAGNRIAGMPYRYGGGHAVENDTAYDCSGSASYVLREAGLMRGSMPSSGFRHYGEGGLGRWISVYARHDHTFLVVAGLRFDTGYRGGGENGPAWTTRGRPATGSVVRHPPGL
jgi:hypothetical protein